MEQKTEQLKTPICVELTFLHGLFLKLPLHLVDNAVIVWDHMTCLPNKNLCESKRDAIIYSYRTSVNHQAAW